MDLTPHDLTKEQREWINTARNLIDFLEAKPELIPQHTGIAVHPEAYGADELAAKLRVLGTAEKYASDTLVGAVRKFGLHEIKVLDWRTNVCERVEVGTEEVTEEIDGDQPIPDGATVVGTTMRQVIRRTVPRYEVKCPPLLAGRVG